MVIIEVILKFIGVGYNNLYQAFVKIYDEDNNLIYKGYSYNGEIKIILDMNKAYRIEAFFYGEIIKTSFYVDNTKIFNFIFNHMIYKPNRTITFLLTDFYYENLKIEKGEMILWQK